MRIREPDIEDATALGSIHVRAWQAAYRGGLMPDDYLDSLSVEERAERWQGWLGRGVRSGGLRLVCELDGRLAGFATGGPEAGAEEAERGELYALNVEPDVWGRGVGGALLEETERRLASSGFPSAILWVHPGNDRARRFYESNGWTVEGATREEDVMGVDVSELRYVRRLRSQRRPSSSS